MTADPGESCRVIISHVAKSVVGDAEMLSSAGTSTSLIIAQQFERRVLTFHAHSHCQTRAPSNPITSAQDRLHASHDEYNVHRSSYNASTATSLTLLILSLEHIFQDFSSPCFGQAHILTRHQALAISSLPPDQ